MNIFLLGYLECRDWDSRKGEPIGEGKYYIQKQGKRLAEFDTKQKMNAWVKKLKEKLSE